MSQKVLVLVKDSKETRIPIKAQRMTLGRDKSCDIVLDDSSISRKHAALIYKNENIYIENISPLGQILKSDRPVEFAELQKEEEARIGAYVIYWQNENEEAPTQPSRNSQEELPASQSEDFALAPMAQDESSNDNFALSTDGSAYNAEIIDASGQAESPLAVGSMGFGEEVSPDEKTAVSQQQARPRLKIIKGEEQSREVKLDNGVVWVVGRSNKCHIQIDNEKLSRHHFKILKINDRYRIQDMGSSSGTKLNGVTISDSPLSPFDTITAGPVEVQFLLVDSAYQHVEAQALISAPAAPLTGSDEAVGNFDQAAPAETLVNVPVPYEDRASSSSSDFYRAPPQSTQTGSFAESSADQTQSGNKPKQQPVEKLKVWWNDLPKNKRIAYSAVASLLILGLLMPSESTEPLALQDSVQVTQNTEARDPASAPAEEANAAQSIDIAPTFFTLSIDKQNQIRKLYADAERAQEKQAWQEVFDKTSEILNYVDKYKKAKDMMLQAQTYINDQVIGKLSSVKDAEDAASSNQEKIALLLDSGSKALLENRWLDAEESFSRALALDPNNIDALNGMAAAANRDSSKKYDGATDPSVLQAQQVSPDEEAATAERESFETYRTQYQIAAEQVRSGEFRKAIPVLEDLYDRMESLYGEYESGQRAPASIRGELISETKALQSQIQEAHNTALSQLNVEYQTQLADADQFIANRQFVQAREIYDSILQNEPYFDEVAKKREDLYAKILVEAKNLYQNALIYESVGDLRNAVMGYQKSNELLANVRDYQAMEYFKKSQDKLALLRR